MKKNFESPLTASCIQSRKHRLEVEIYQIIIAIALGATGFWKIIEMLLERNKYKAETVHLYAQVNSQIITNWISWSQKLEERVKDLEGCNADMELTIQRQKEKITGLEKQVGHLEEQNTALKEEIEELKP